MRSRAAIDDALVLRLSSRRSMDAAGGSVTRIRFLLFGVPTVLAMFFIAVPPAGAAAPVPFTVDDHVDFNTGVATFTATGPLCASGTFVDDTRVVAGSPTIPKANVLVTSVYTCDDGSGTFNLLKHLFITFGPDSFTITAPKRSWVVPEPTPAPLGTVSATASATSLLGSAPVKRWVSSACIDAGREHAISPG
jgi:hypothetical protein